jgi:hypothetical protein
LQDTLYRGGKLNGLDIPKDMMAEAELECLDCHLSESDSIVRSGKAKCIECHDDDYGEMFTEWQTSIQELINTLSASIKNKGKLNLSDQDKSFLREAGKILQEIRTDGSSGVHNYVFIEETLTDMIERVDSLNNLKE